MAPAPTAPKGKIPVWGWALAAAAFVGVFFFMQRQGSGSSQTTSTAADTAPATETGGGALTPDQSSLYSDLSALAAYLQANGLTPPPTTGSGNLGVTPGFLGPPVSGSGTPSFGGTIPPLTSPPPGQTIIGSGPGPHPVTQ